MDGLQLRPPHDALHTVNILIVDDLAENRRSLRAMLDRPDYTVVEAGSGSAALAELSRRDFAVVLLETVMPDMDGFRLAELVRARQAVPILFVTGHAANADVITRGYRVGAADYLVKPLVAEIVCAKVAVFAQIFRQRQQIESALHEKEILLRELHHRVKNNLQIISSLLNLQASRQSDDVKQLFVETTARVRSIALVHEQLHRSDNFAAIDLSGYIRALTTGLLQTYGSLHIDMTVHVASMAVSIDTAIPCGLIVNELVSNALKHAFPDDRPGEITVTLTEKAGTFTLEVRDDGVGIPNEIDTANVKTMGLQLVRSLAQQLGGTTTFHRERGTRVHIEFPRPHAST